MPRQVRIEFEDAVYHVLARGNQRQLIFLDRKDRETFIRTLGETCERTEFEVLAWILMGNHYHLVVRTPNANLVDGMRWLQNTYTRRFNVRHQQWGRLFGDRYKSILVDDADTGSDSGTNSYLSSLIDYVLLNPARARIVQASKGESILDYKWSSLTRGMACRPAERAEWLDGAGVLTLRGLPDTVRGRKSYVDYLDARIRSEEADKCGFPKIKGVSLHSTLQRGWYWGSQAFCEQLHKLLDQSTDERRSRDYAQGLQGRDHAVRSAEAIVAQAKNHFGLENTDLKDDLKRGDRRRAAVAWAIWRQTSVSQSWIAEQTGLSSATNVSQQVRRFNKMPASKLSKAERKWKTICQ